MIRHFANSIKRIDYVEYDKDNLFIKRNALRAISNNSFSFTNLELAFATARATIGNSMPESVISIAEIRSSFYNLMTLEDMRFSDFRLNSNSLNRYRDFSKTTRTGEIAQGVSFLFAQKVLQKRVVIDFKLFFEKLNQQIEGNVSTPDYIIADNIYGGVELMESKGGIQMHPNYIKSRLIRANNQCRSGESVINALLGWRVNSSFSCCTSFENENSTLGTKIHYTDPPYRNNKDADLLRLFRFHYAAWFLLAGDFKNAKLLLTDNAPEVNQNNSIVYKTKLKDEKFIPIASEIDQFKFNNLYISLEILEKLEKKSTTPIENNFEIFSDSNSGNFQKNESILFRDGILYKSELVS